MTELIITPNYDKKTARFKGTIAGGESVKVTIVGAANWLSDGLRLRVVCGCTKTVAIFPLKSEEGSVDSFKVEGDNLIAAPLELNTIQARLHTQGLTAITATFIVEDVKNNILYFQDSYELHGWIKRCGDDEPYDLTKFPGLIDEWTEQIDNMEVSAKRVDNGVEIVAWDGKGAKPAAVVVLDGKKGDKGDALTWEDLTDEQKASLKGKQGEKGDTAAHDLVPCDEDGAFYRLVAVKNKNGEMVLALEQEPSEANPEYIKFADIINVKDYGAKGDGKTDDADAIQAALTEAGKIIYESRLICAVYFPRGDYYTTKTLEIESMGTVLLANRTMDRYTTISVDKDFGRNSEGGKAIINSNFSSITIKGLTFKQNGINPDYKDSEHKTDIEPTAIGIKINHKDIDCDIRDCGFLHLLKGVDLYGHTGSVKESFFYNCAYGVYCNQPSDKELRNIVVRENHFHVMCGGCRYDLFSDSACVHFPLDSDATDKGGNEVSGNNAISSTVLVWGNIRGGTIRDNTLFNATGLFNCVISVNFDPAYNFAYLDISGNNIGGRYSYAQGEYDGCGIHIEGLSNVKITDNTITSTLSHSLLVKDCANITVENNRFDRPNTLFLDSNFENYYEKPLDSAIHLEGGATTGVCKDNFISTNAAKAPYALKHFIELRDCGNLIVANNVTRGKVEGSDIHKTVVNNKDFIVSNGSHNALMMSALGSTTLKRGTATTVYEDVVVRVYAKNENLSNDSPQKISIKIKEKDEIITIGTLILPMDNARMYPAKMKAGSSILYSVDGGEGEKVDVDFVYVDSISKDVVD
jgi:parallel beta-helix repeat protein